MKRFIQEPSTCGIAASACIGNYYNKKIDFEKAKNFALTLINDLYDGTWSSQLGIIFNNMGFQKVTIVGTDLDYLDYKFNKMSKKNLIKTLKKLDDKVEKSYKGMGIDMAKFLEESYKNKLIVDYNFKDYIISCIDQKKPILTNYHWEIFHRFPDTLKDGYTEHSVVCHGYDDKKVYFIDSHIEYYKKHLKKYKNGRYGMSWDVFFTVMGRGDIIIPEQYDEKKAHELFQ